VKRPPSVHDGKVSCVKRFSHVLSRVEETIVAVSLGGAAAIIVLSVIMRYVFQSPLSWAEEGAILLLIYSTFVGASLALREREHVGIDIITLKMSKRTKRATTFVAMGLTLVYCGVLGFYGWIMATSPSAFNNVTPAIRIPVWMTQLAVPLGLTLMFLRALEAIISIARGEEPEEKTLLDDAGGSAL
jgi:C4-dicarboxylate transporter DctQ subunit